MPADLKGYDLKKQSQFAKGENIVKSILTMGYGDIGEWVQRKNKPNSKPIYRALAGNPKQEEGPGYIVVCQLRSGRLSFRT